LTPGDFTDAFASFIDARIRQEVTLMTTTTTATHRSLASLKLPNKVPAVTMRGENTKQSSMLMRMSPRQPGRSPQL
jgi:hypothetical protein